MISVMRHEGWHAPGLHGRNNREQLHCDYSQSGEVPKMYQAIAKVVMHRNHTIPWEKEAYWAGHTEGMTAKALSLVPQELCGLIMNPHP